MGKNLYETPRDKNKWNLKNDFQDKKVTHDANDQKHHIEELKKRFEKNKK